MKYCLILLVFGILWRNTLAMRLDNPVFYDLERRLVRLEARQFSQTENIEHRMLQLEMQLATQEGEEKLEMQLATQEGEEKPNAKLIEIAQEKEPYAEKTFLQRLEELEKSWEKELQKQLAEFSAKHENLSEKFAAIEKHLEETQRKNAINNNTKESDFLMKPKDITHEDEEERENGSGDGDGE